MDDAPKSFTQWYEVSEQIMVYAHDMACRAYFLTFTDQLCKLLLGDVATAAKTTQTTIRQQTNAALEATSIDDPAWDTTPCDRLLRLASVLEPPGDFVRFAKLSAAFLKLGKRVLAYIDDKDGLVLSSRLNSDSKIILGHLLSAKKSAAILMADAAKPMDLMQFITGSDDDSQLTIAVAFLKRLYELVLELDT